MKLIPDDENIILYLVLLISAFVFGCMCGGRLSRSSHEKDFVNKVCIEKQYEFCKPDVTVIYTYQKAKQEWSADYDGQNGFYS